MTAWDQETLKLSKVVSSSLVGVAEDTQEAERLRVRLFVLDVVDLAISLLDAQMLQPKL